MKFQINVPKFLSFESASAKAARELAEKEMQLENEFIVRLAEFEADNKKYLEEAIRQLQAMDKSLLVSIPSISPNSKTGKKGLPLEICVREAYLINPTVYACVQTIAQSVSMVKFTLHEKQKDGQYTVNSTHEVIDLLDNPNKLHTRQEFITLLIIDLLLCGNALVWENTDKNFKRNKPYKQGNGVSELIILNPDWVEYEANGFEIIRYRGRKETPYEGNTWEAEELIHFRLPNPLNHFWGISPIQAAYKAVDIDSKIINWWLKTLENGCKKDAVVKFKHDLTDAQYLRINSLIERQVAGFDQGRGYLILGHEADFQFLDIAPAELDFSNSRKNSKEAIASIFRVPPPMIGDMGNASYNNVDAMLESFWLDTIMPLVQNICSTLTKRLLPEFNLDVKKFYIGFDPMAVQPLKQLYFKAWKCIIDMVGVGVPLNMAIKKLDLQLPHIKGGDQGYMSHNFVPLGFYDDQTTMNVNDPNTRKQSSDK